MKVVLLGMNNPVSSDPKFALWPAPVGCAGWRLWKMLENGFGVTVRQYLSWFERRNLVSEREWSSAVARAAARELRPELAGRRVAVFGRQVWDALRLPRVTPLDGLTHGQTTLLYVPHPSGLSRWYNEPANRESAARAIMWLYVEASCPTT